ncbi:SusC/RagA family TonB-linked outer membrane protein [Bacteroidia bacterium]|nr:SusC/RagA family TonB-linked outer membrane protein [Bacteroidia bacterium]
MLRGWTQRLLCGLLIATPLAGWGQAASPEEITGMVTDQNGAPLPGVVVNIPDQNRTSVSDRTGTFQITPATRGQSVNLSFSFLGYLTNNMQAAPGSNISVKMESDVMMLDEVVAIGYGSQTKREITAAITSINAEDLSGFVGSSIEQSIAGLAPGVRIQTSDATPGGDIDIEVRGVGTVNAGAQPLFVVDGVPYDGGLSSINPDDVESIQILKDAASTAVYGSRGANGVFIITTKKGKAGTPVVSVNTTTTIAQAARKFQVMSTPQLLEWLNDKSVSDRYRYTTNQSQDYYPFDAGLNTDWQDAVFHNAVQQKYNISVSGGVKDLTYRVSAEYFDQPGVVIYTGMKRATFRANIDYNVRKWLKMGFNIAPSSTGVRKTREGGPGSNGVIRTALVNYPFFPVYLPDGSFFSLSEYSLAPSANAIVAGVDPDTGKFPDSSLSGSPLQKSEDNPVFIAREYKNLANAFRTTGNTYLLFNIAKGLTFKPSFSIELWSQTQSEWYPSSIGKTRTDSSASLTSARRRMWMSENILTWDKSLGNHKLSLMGGVTWQSIENEVSRTSAYKFATMSLPSINGGIVNGGSYDDNPEHLNSFVSRASYNYKRKYLLQAVFRIDGSTRFGPNYQYASFPSVSGGWVMSDEKFMRGIKWLSELKWRASWGIAGNNNIGLWNYQTKMGQKTYVIDGQIAAGWAPDNIGNPNLRWEKSVQYNAGVDLGLIRNRVYIQFDIYRSTTEDMLLNTTVPGTLGVTRMLQNVGSVRNDGIEFNIVSRNLTRKLQWTTTFNISANRNEVLALGIDSEAIYAGDNESNITKVGYPMGMFYGRVFGGIYQSQAEIDALRNDPYSGLAFDPNVRPGDCKWYDLNGDGVYDDNDRAIVGNPYPLFIAGMTNTFRWRNFTFSFQLNGQYGNQIYNYALHQLLDNGNTGMNKSILLVDRWRPGHPGNGIADRTTTSNDVKPTADMNKFSNRLLEDGSYLTIRNMQFSYAFDKRLIKKISLQSLVLSFNVDNAYTFTRYTGLNPESSSERSAAVAGDRQESTTPVASSATRASTSPTSPGIDRMGYPISRNYSLTVSLKF